MNRRSDIFFRTRNKYFLSFLFSAIILSNVSVCACSTSTSNAENPTLCNLTMSSALCYAILSSLCNAFLGNGYGYIYVCVVYVGGYVLFGVTGLNEEGKWEMGI